MRSGSGRAAGIHIAPSQRPVLTFAIVTVRSCKVPLGTTGAFVCRRTKPANNRPSADSFLSLHLWNAAAHHVGMT